MPSCFRLKPASERSEAIHRPNDVKGFLRPFLILAGVALFSLSGILIASKGSTPLSTFLGWIFLATGIGCCVGSLRLAEPGTRRNYAIGMASFGLIGFCAFGGLFPVFASAREAQGRTNCVRNTRNLGNSLNAYLADWDERFPPAQNWHTLCTPYAVHTERCFRGKLLISYGFNSALSFVNLAAVEDVVKTPMIFETEAEDPNAHGGIESFAVRHGVGGNFSAVTGQTNFSRPETLHWKP